MRVLIDFDHYPQIKISIDNFIYYYEVDSIMENPLSCEEKVVLAHLIDHDYRTHFLDTAQLGPGTEEIRRVKYIHCQIILNAIKDMMLSDNCSFLPASPEKIQSKLRNLVKIIDDQRVNVDMEVFMSLNTNLSVVYTMLHNLVNNSLRYIPDAGEVQVKVDEYTGETESNIYTSPSDLEYCIRFSVTDNGTGFPEKYSLDHWFEMGQGEGTLSHRGFGLYFVKLGCRFLRCGLNAESEPGNTQVTIYHPLTLL